MDQDNRSYFTFAPSPVHGTDVSGIWLCRNVEFPLHKGEFDFWPRMTPFIVFPNAITPTDDDSGPYNGSSSLSSVTDYFKQQLRGDRGPAAGIGKVYLQESMGSKFRFCLDLHNRPLMQKLRTLLISPRLELTFRVIRYLRHSEEVEEIISIDEDIVTERVDISTEQRNSVSVSCGVHWIGNAQANFQAFLSIRLFWSEPGPNAIIQLSASPASQFENLSNSSSDLTIVAEDGVESQCHRKVLESQSPVLAAMVSPDTGMRESLTGRLELPDKSSAAVEQLLRYLYCLRLDTNNLSCGVAVELYKMAHEYALTYLELSLRELLIRKPRSWYKSNPDALLELYFHAINLEEFALVGRLRERCFRVMARMSREIYSCDVFKGLDDAESMRLSQAISAVWNDG